MAASGMWQSQDVAASGLRKRPGCGSVLDLDVAASGLWQRPGCGSVLDLVGKEVRGKAQAQGSAHGRPTRGGHPRPHIYKHIYAVYPRKLIGYTPGFGRRQHLGQAATEEIRRRRGQILALAGRNFV